VPRYGVIRRGSRSTRRARKRLAPGRTGRENIVLGDGEGEAIMEGVRTGFIRKYREYEKRQCGAGGDKD